MHFDMLNKSELKITNIRLNRTNLNAVADCVADLFHIPRDEVLVIDVRNDEVALDILSSDIDPHSFVGQEKKLLERLAQIPGVTLASDSHITSEGMLGWIAFDDPGAKELKEAVDRAEQMAEELVNRVAKRVIVYPSGTEVENGEIEDTNTPMLVNALNEAGFKAEAGSILKDDENHIVQKLMEAVYKGYGIVVTTGGVGAEDKDHSVESVLRIDSNAATPYIAKFTKGHGRHVKDGIRIAVGQYEHVRFITLPGPNDEVSACLPVLIDGLQCKLSKQKLADNLAETLRNRLKDKMHPHIHN